MSASARAAQHPKTQPPEMFAASCAAQRPPEFNPNILLISHRRVAGALSAAILIAPARLGRGVSYVRLPQIFIIGKSLRANHDRVDETSRSGSCGTFSSLYIHISRRRRQKGDTPALNSHMKADRSLPISRFRRTPPGKARIRKTRSLWRFGNPFSKLQRY